MNFFLIFITLFSFSSFSKNTDEIRSIIKNKISEKILPCHNKLVTDYQESGKSAQMLEGKIIATFAIDDIGKISDFQIKESTVMSPEVFEMCIRTPLESETFPAAKKKTREYVSYPFVFNVKK